MSTPRVTVAIPFFDEEKRLGDAIRSVLRQTFRDFELLLVDDGSTDASLAIARRFDDPRIIVMADGRRKYLPTRLNEIVERARADLIARMDGDDVMHPTRLEREVETIEREKADIVGTRVVFVDEQDEPFAVGEGGPMPPTPASALLFGTVPHPTLLGRRQFFVENPYAAAYTRSEDRELWCRTASLARFHMIPECLHVMRVCGTDADFLAGYLTSQRQNRMLMKRFGPAAVGPLRSLASRGASIAKELVMTSFVKTGQTKRLLVRRGRPPTVEERALAREAIAAAQRA